LRPQRVCPACPPGLFAGALAKSDERSHVNHLRSHFKKVEYFQKFSKVFNRFVLKPARLVRKYAHLIDLLAHLIYPSLPVPPNSTTQKKVFAKSFLTRIINLYERKSHKPFFAEGKSGPQYPSSAPQGAIITLTSVKNLYLQTFVF